MYRLEQFLYRMGFGNPMENRYYCKLYMRLLQLHIIHINNKL